MNQLIEDAAEILENAQAVNFDRFSTPKQQQAQFSQL